MMRLAPRDSLPAYVVLGVALALTLLATYGAWLTQQAEIDRRFSEDVDEVREAVEKRMAGYVDTLIGGAALLGMQSGITADQWGQYVHSLDLPRRYPGSQGLGVAAAVPASAKSAFLAALHKQGPVYANFRIFPPGERPLYVPVTYLEPRDARNRGALGFDMYVESARREAMARARDTGRAVATAPVHLVQDDVRSSPLGFLIYAPAYRSDMPHATVAQRRASFIGFAFSPIRTQPLFESLITSNLRERLYIAFSDRGTEGPLFFASAPQPPATTLRTRRLSVTVAGRPWLLEIRLPAGVPGEGPTFPWNVFFAGIFASGLLFATTWSLATSRRRALALADAMTAELRQADRSKDEFLSVISHELRTPLNFIMGFASILDDEVAGPLSAQQHSYLHKILNGSERMLLLVNDLLDFAKIQAGKFELTCQDTAFRPLVAEVVETLSPLAERKGLSLSYDVPAELHGVIDEQRMLQVLSNLLSNAIKFTATGGSVRLVSWRDGDELLTEVCDTGIGIAERDQPKLFTRFKQLDMSATRQAGGTGLGLSIAKAFVEAHGGTIGLRSQPGVGSTFWFRLPLGGAGRCEGR